MEMKVKSLRLKSLRLKCGFFISLLLLTVATFLGHLSHSEYKSHMRKRKVRKQTHELQTNLEHIQRLHSYGAQEPTYKAYCAPKTIKPPKEII